MSERRVNQQSAVDTWYGRLYNDLETGYHATLAWSLIMMGRADAQLSRPPYQEFFNRHKDVLLKAVLTTVANKDPDIQYSNRELSEMMIGVEKLGLDWPELDVIERSLEKDGIKRIIESTYGDVESIIDALTHGSGNTFAMAVRQVKNLDQQGMEMLRSGMAKKKNSIMANMIDMFFVPDTSNIKNMIRLMNATDPGWPEVSDLPQSIKPVVIDDLVNRMHTAGFASAIEDLDVLSMHGFDRGNLLTMIRTKYLPTLIDDYAIDSDVPARILGSDLLYMLELGGVDLDHLSRVVNQRKNNILRSILIAIKHRNYYDANLFVQALRDLEIDWDELTAIEKSLGSTDTLGESSGRLMDFARSEIEDLVKTSAAEMFKYPTSLALRGMLSRLINQYDLTQEEISEFIQPAMPAILHKIKTALGRGTGIAISLRDMAEMAKLGLLTPEIMAAVEANKPNIMKHILNHIGNHKSALHGMDYVEQLGLIGIKWPEMDTISKAANAEYKERRLNWHNDQ